MVARLAAFAVLCQLTLAVPAALFMAGEYAGHSRAVVAAHDHRHGDRPAPAGHDHQRCAQYQTGLAAALPAGIAITPPPALPVASDRPIPEDRPAATLRVAYQSRAPPTTV